jgi:photosystem II stability/assembly factor-like uncharacterized protein
VTKEDQSTHIRTILVAMLGMLLCGAAISCTRRTESPRSGDVYEATPSLWPQLRSLSITGPTGASVLVGPVTGRRELRVTSDAGKTWRVIDSREIGDMLDSATFRTEGAGWAINNGGEIFRLGSSDSKWRKLANLTDVPDSGFIGARRIEFVTDSTGWLEEIFGIWRSTDGGQTWKKKLGVTTPGVKSQPARISPLDSETLAALGDGEVYLTRDGGESWSIQQPVQDRVTLTSVQLLNRRHGYLTGYFGRPNFRSFFYQSTDGGASWREVNVDLGILPESVWFVNEREGWICGSRPNPGEDAVAGAGVLLRTSDGGKNWQPVEIGSDDPFFKVVRFSDVDNGWLVGRDNLYRTSDAGKTWVRVLSAPPIANLASRQN